MYPLLKGPMDRLLALFAIIVLSPLFVLLAVVIKLDSRGPVFFKQRRIGKDKNEFQLVKFRTMRNDTPSEVPTHLMTKASSYITKSGAFLRKTSLDELPQLFNVLLGTMSLVGPRPALWNQVLLITGAGGSIGSELARQLASYNIEELILLDSYENGLFSLGQTLQSMKVNYRLRILSIQDADALQELFETTKPQLVYHAAAHKHVPLMEDSPKEAIKNNIQGSYNVFQSAMSVGAEHVVVISTDKAVNPTNIMGATKRVVERVMQTVASNSKTIFSAVRFGNVLGSNGSVIPLFEAQIAQGGPVLVTDPAIKRYFMTIPEAVQLVLESSLYAKGGDIFVLDMGEPIFIKDLAESMIRLAGFEPHQDIPIKYTGLRPGEKMFEELVLDSNVVSKTANQKIFIETATEEPIDLTQIHSQDYLRSLVQATINLPVETSDVPAT